MLNPNEIENLANEVASRLLGDSSSRSRMVSKGSTALGRYTSSNPVLRTEAAPQRTVAIQTHGESSVAYPTLDEAAAAAEAAQPKWASIPMARRKEIISEMRAVLRRSVDELSRLAVEETGLGRYEDKVSKNLLVINKTPGPEYLEASAFTGDDGMALVEYAPFGVIGAITPTTNPSETVINNGISMLSAGNTVVFNPHPSAKRVSMRAAEIMSHVIVSMGGPHGCLAFPAEPTIKTAQALMTHPKVRLLVVTGGPAVVKAAMASGKKVIAAGPGNPPAVVDETADIQQAAEGIVKGASLDNNIVCIAEKEIIAVDAIADSLKKALQKAGGYLLSPHQVRQLEKVVLTKDESGFHTNKEFVGKNANAIAKEIGLNLGDDVRILFCEVPEEHPFVQVELLMPVLGLVRARDVMEAIDMAKRVEHGNGHTATMYSKNIDHLHHMAKVINTSIFIKNAPSYAGLGLGGEGYTSFTIASPTGEGLTNARTFSRIRRCTLKDHFRIV